MKQHVGLDQIMNSFFTKANRCCANTYSLLSAGMKHRHEGVSPRRVLSIQICVAFSGFRHEYSSNEGCYLSWRVQAL
jgi:hypothetical protein